LACNLRYENAFYDPWKEAHNSSFYEMMASTSSRASSQNGLERKENCLSLDLTTKIAVQLVTRLEG